MGRQHVYRTRNRNKTFRRQWDEALEQAVDLLEGEARRRATGISRDIYYAGKVVGAERVYSDMLLIFLLKAHRPHLYRDNVKVEHSGGMEVTGDRKVTFEFVRPSESLALDADGAPARVLGCDPRDQPCRSLPIRGRPGCRARRFHVQYPRHAVRCQRMTVSGGTITRVERQPGQYRERHDQKRRSAGFV